MSDVRRGREYAKRVEVEAAQKRKPEFTHILFIDNLRQQKISEREYDIMRRVVD